MTVDFQNPPAIARRMDATIDAIDDIRRQYQGDGVPRLASGQAYDPITGDPKDAAWAFLHAHQFTAHDLMGVSFPPLRQLVDGMIGTGLVLLVAAPKIGKSWLCLDLAYQASIGGRAFGCIRMASRPVLYMALEDGPRRLQSRMARLGITDAPESLVFLVDLAGRDVTGTIASFLDSNHDDRPLVILDTLGKVKGMASRVTGESDFERDYRLMGDLKTTVDQCDGATLLIVHHTRKMGSGDFLDTISGTNGISGAADTIVKIDRHRNSRDGVLQVTSRDAAEGEYSMLFDSDTGLWSLVGGSLDAAADAAREARQTDDVGDLMTDVIHLVNENPAGLKPFEVGQRLDISAQKAGKYLKRAADADRIRNPSRGLYTPVD